MPLWVVVFLLSILGDAQTESLCFFKRVELKALLHGVHVGVPAFGTTTIDNILDNVLVHLLQLSLATFVKQSMLLQKLGVSIVRNVAV